MFDKMDEIYKEIDKNYAVSNYGNVVNKNTGRILKTQINCHGYKQVKLSNDGIVKVTKIHRLVGIAFIPNPENKRNIDHINNDKLNNHESNLRWATNEENNRNSLKRKNTSSQFKGVCFQKRDNIWQAQIKINKKQIHLGSYKTQEEAGQSYNQYIINHNLEEFFKLNEI